MNCGEVADVCRQFLRGGYVLRGCFLADQLPIRKDRTTYNEFFVVNILTSRHRPTLMGHYVLVVVGKYCIAYFDSYGIKPHIYSPWLQRFINQYYDKSFLDISRHLQSIDSLTCGAYAIFIMYHINLHGIDYIVNFLRFYFSQNDFRYNDRKVIRFLYRNFKMPRCERLFCNESLSKKECERMFCGIGN